MQNRYMSCINKFAYEIQFVYWFYCIDVHILKWDTIKYSIVKIVSKG